jgi:hypothetical protein
MVKDSAVRSKAVFFLPILVASGYFAYVGYEERLVNDVTHRRHRSFKVRSIQCKRMLKYDSIY